MRQEREVIYLTGPPATGKTTLVGRLREAFPQLSAFVYSELLARHISNRQDKALAQEELRRKSGLIVTPADVIAVDRRLVRDVSRLRKHQHVLVDSHPVTKERYGFRVTAFSVQLLSALEPTRICMLYTEADTVISRIKKEAKGRPRVSPFEADFHCFAQASVAICYGIQLGVPVYFYDASKNADHAFQEIGNRLRR